MLLSNIRVNFLLDRFQREISRQTADLVTSCRNPYKADAKDKIPLVNFGINLSPTQRQLRSGYDFGGTRVLVLDYDKGLKYEDFAKQYSDLYKCQHIAYATASNSDETPKWRAMFPLAKHVSESDLKLLIPRLNRLFPESDHSAWQSSRFHNIPADLGQPYWYYLQDGELVDIYKLVGVDDDLLAFLRQTAKDREDNWREEYDNKPRITKSVRDMEIRDLGLTIAEWLSTPWSSMAPNGGRRVMGSYRALCCAIKYNDWQTVKEIKRHSERCGLKGLDKTIAKITAFYGKRS